MLEMRQINYITESVNVVGKSISEIARESGYSRNTIRKYLNQTDYNHVPRKRKQSILDPFKATIDQWLENDLSAHYKQRHTARRVFDRLVTECDYPGKIRTVEIYVRKKKMALRQRVQDTALDLTRPVEEAQVDFGQFHYWDKNGKDTVGNHLVVSFPSSNACYWQVTKSQNQECLLEGLQTIFEYIGGVPKRMVFDNMSSAVAHIEKDGNRILTEQFGRFIRHHSIEAKFCNPAKGQEKGNVEANVGYQRRNMLVPVPIIKDLVEFNVNLFHKCEKEMQRNHHEIKKPIIELFVENKRALACLPLKRFIVGRTMKVKTDKYSYFRFEKNTYSTKPGLVCQEILIQVTASTIRVLDLEYNEIDTHERYYKPIGEPIVHWKNYISLISKKPKAIKYTAFYKSLPPIWRMALESLGDSECAEVLKKYGNELLVDIPESFTKALEEVMKKERINVDTLAMAIRRQQDGVSVKEIVFTKDNVPDLTPYKTSLDKYDAMMKRGVAA